jgi:hypothetical protein
LVDEREVLGRGILHKLSELKMTKFYENFSLYLGHTYENIPLHKVTTKTIKGETIYEHFMLDKEGTVTCVRNRQLNITEYDEMEDEDPSLSNIPLNEPKDFLKISYEATLSLNKVVTDESFYEDLAWRLNKQDKPGYKNVWKKDVAKEKK